VVGVAADRREHARRAAQAVADRAALRGALERGVDGDEDPAVAARGQRAVEERELRGVDRARVAPAARHVVQEHRAHARPDVVHRVGPSGAVAGQAGAGQASDDLVAGEQASPRIRAHRGGGARQVARGQQSACGLLRRGPLPGDAAGEGLVRCHEALPAHRGRPQARRGLHLAADEHVVVAGQHGDRAAQPRGAEGGPRAVQQARPARRIDVGAVVERVGVAGALQAAGVERTDRAAAQRADRGVELVLLAVVGQVARDDRQVGAQRVDGARGRGEGLERQRLLGPEDGGERGAQAVEERDARGRGRVAHVGVGELGDDAQRAPGPGCRPAGQLGAVAERLARRGLQDAGARGIAERHPQRGPRVGAVGAGGRRAAAHEDPGGKGEQRGDDEQRAATGGGGHRVSPPGGRGRGARRPRGGRPTRRRRPRRGRTRR
jgi:hypothetical protein